MKIYLAASYLRREQIREYAKELELPGRIKVTSTWLEGKEEEIRSQPGYDIEALNDQCAINDLADVVRADYLLLFTETAESDKKYKTGGRMVEFGFAMGLGKRVGICGPFENVFTYLNGIDRFASFDEAYRALTGLRRGYPLAILRSPESTFKGVVVGTD